MTALILENVAYREESSGNKFAEIRLDFSNDRHHIVKIKPPYSKQDVVDALLRLAYHVGRDRLLEES